MQPFPVFDATFDAGDVAPGMLPSYWTSGAPFSDGLGNYSPTPARVRALAQVVRDGGMSFDNRPVAKGTFTVLDFEPSQNNSPQYLLKRLQWFRKVARNANISLYGYPLLDYGVNRTDIINPSPATRRAPGRFLSARDCWPELCMNGCEHADSSR